MGGGVFPRARKVLGLPLDVWWWIFRVISHKTVNGIFKGRKLPLLKEVVSVSKVNKKERELWNLAHLGVYPTSATEEKEWLLSFSTQATLCWSAESDYVYIITWLQEDLSTLSEIFLGGKDSCVAQKTTCTFKFLTKKLPKYMLKCLLSCVYINNSVMLYFNVFHTFI